MGVLLCSAIAWPVFARADERLWISASINGQPVRLAFDTGSSHLLLFRKGAARLGLRVTNAPPDVKLNPGEVPMGRTEPCRLTVESDPEFTTSFGVVDVPAVLDRVCDGLIGWGALSPGIIEINARAGVVSQLTNVPSEAVSWITFRIQTNSNTLRLDVPDSHPFSIAVDTGSSQGVQLSPPKWREWRANHPHQAATEHADFVPGSGLVVGEEIWAAEISFGPLTLTDVPLIEASQTDFGLGGADYHATLGLTALKRLDLILDGKKGIAYLRPRRSPPLPYQHNRLGAVFTPASIDGGDLLAHVAPGSPADKAGIRNGDVLLTIDDTDVTKWHSDPSILPLSRFWERPAGTKLELTLNRNGEKLKMSVVLKDILFPNRVP